MHLQWMVFLLLYFLYCYHSTRGTEQQNKRGKVPIVFNYMDEAKRVTLKRKQSQHETQSVKQHDGYSLQVLIYDPECQRGHSETLALQPFSNITHLNSTNHIEYIPEDEDPVHNTERATRIKRWGHHHYGHHHHHKPVSLDFGCNSDNFHEHITKQHIASGSSDGTTSAPSTSSSSDDHHPLSLFIKRPQHNYQRPHHHGPHLTFRCNAHNHHIFKHFRRSSK